jgi:hypothetical protein
MPTRSKLVRGTTAALARRRGTEGEGDHADEDALEGTADAKTQLIAASSTDPNDLAPVELDPPVPLDDATPASMKPAAPASRKRNETMLMGESTNIGSPPEMPRSAAPPPLVLGEVENPTHLPGPREVPSGDPGDPASPPGLVPPGDSRSLRRGDEFALVYRIGTCVISRSGTLGTRGQWRVVEYPTSAAASNSYAKECSRFVSEGFSDYRG